MTMCSLSEHGSILVHCMIRSCKLTRFGLQLKELKLIGVSTLIASSDIIQLLNRTNLALAPTKKTIVNMTQR
jgi:hypothetical protein